MVRDKKLDALFRSREADEHIAAREKVRVDEVVHKRAQAVEELQNKRSALLDRWHQLTTRKRYSALQAGDIFQVSSISRYGRRIKAEIARIEKLLGLRTSDLERAAQRAEGAHQELVDSRVEKKKIEQLMDRQQRSARIRKIAEDESESDDLSTYRRNKDK